MTHAKMPSEVAQRIYDLLVASKVALYGADAMLFYGDQNKIPVSPTICVEAGTVDRPLVGAMGPQGRVENAFTTYILIYHGRIQDVQVTKKEAEAYAEATAAFLDNNPRLVLGDGPDGKLIHGYCKTIDHGYANRNGTLMYGSRITHTGKTKMQLGV